MAAGSGYRPESEMRRIIHPAYPPMAEQSRTQAQVDKINDAMLAHLDAHNITGGGYWDGPVRSANGYTRIGVDVNTDTHFPRILGGKVEWLPFDGKLN